MRKVFPDLPPQSSLDMEQQSASSLVMARLVLDNDPLLASSTFKFRTAVSTA